MEQCTTNRSFPKRKNLVSNLLLVQAETGLTASPRGRTASQQSNRQAQRSDRFCVESISFSPEPFLPSFPLFSTRSKHLALAPLGRRLLTGPDLPPPAISSASKVTLGSPSSPLSIPPIGYGFPLLILQCHGTLGEGDLLKSGYLLFKSPQGFISFDSPLHLAGNPSPLYLLMLPHCAYSQLF